MYTIGKNKSCFSRPVGIVRPIFLQGNLLSTTPLGEVLIVLALSDDPAPAMLLRSSDAVILQDDVEHLEAAELRLLKSKAMIGQTPGVSKERSNAS